MFAKTGPCWRSASINWLVTDQLGTPRMIFDHTGALATVKRHDYAPFGEELFNGARTTAMGYAADSTRQKFTSKERDNETGLDYSISRYYSSAQGRFSSVDPLGVSATTANPQTWNRYSYVLNMPVNLVDPNGKDGCELGKTCSFTTNDWATNGNHPEQGQIQETVNVNISGQDAIQTTTDMITNLDLSGASSVLQDSYIPTPGTMPNQGGHDTADQENFMQLNVGVNLIGVAGVDFSVTRDDWGNWYLAAGPGVGLSLPINGSLVSGVTLSDLNIPTYNERDMIDILSGPSTTVTVGAGWVGTRSWNNPVVLGNTIPLIPKGGGTRGSGIGFPQAGLSQQDAFKIPFLKF